MKKFILLLILACCFFNVIAQQTTTRSFRIDEHTIVKDSVGKAYSFAAWTKLMKTGLYTLMPENMQAASPAFLLVRKSDMEKQHQAMIAKYGAAASANRTTGAMQGQSAPRAPMKYVPPGENSVVKDSSNFIYPYAVWQNMLSTGNYNMRLMFAGPDSGVYFINKRSQQEKDAMAAQLPKPEPSDRFKIGDDFGNLKLKDINGEKLDLKAMVGKVTWLIFGL